MIRDKVSQLDALCRELRAANPTDDYRLLPPAAPGEIRAHERRAPHRFPPSFREFLDLANGWRGFMRGLTLLGLRRRETELFFREGVDEKVFASIPDLVPEHELRSLSTREKTDPKVLDPRSRIVFGIDGKGGALVFDERSGGTEPAVALVKTIWVQRTWPSFESLLDDAIAAATRELDAKRAALAPAPEKGGKRAAAAAAKRARAKAAAEAKKNAVPKLRVVELRPSRRPATKGKKVAAAATTKAKGERPVASDAPKKARKPAKKR